MILTTPARLLEWHVYGSGLETARERSDVCLPATQ